MIPHKPAQRQQFMAARTHTAPPVRRIPAKFKLIAFVLVALFISGHFAWAQHASAEVAAAKQQQIQLAAEQARKASVFANQVQAIVATHPELSLNIVVAPGASAIQQFGALTTFDAASTGKLVTAADFLHHVERGQSSLTTIIDGQTAEYWLKIMIINSDDNAWSELNDYLGHDDLQQYAQTIGFTDYDADSNTLTARDITSLLQQLYGRTLLSSADRSLLLSYMATANYRDFIVPAVPAGDMVYHKIGMDDDSVHDAAIIAHGSSSLVLTIFTDGHGSYNWDARKLIMQQITRDAIAAYL